MHADRVDVLRDTAFVPNVVVVAKDYPGRVPNLVSLHGEEAMPQMVLCCIQRSLQVLELGVPLLLPDGHHLDAGAVCALQFLDDIVSPCLQLWRGGRPTHGKDKLSAALGDVLSAHRSQHVLQSLQAYLFGDVHRHEADDKDRCTRVALPKCLHLQFCLPWRHFAEQGLLLAVGLQNNAHPAGGWPRAIQQPVLQAVPGHSHLLHECVCREATDDLGGREVPTDDDTAFLLAPQDLPHLAQILLWRRQAVAGAAVGRNAAAAKAMAVPLHDLAEPADGVAADVLFKDVTAGKLLVLAISEGLRSVIPRQLLMHLFEKGLSQWFKLTIQLSTRHIERAQLISIRLPCFLLIAPKFLWPCPLPAIAGQVLRQS
mmetsp:Transcript_24045/g.68914  ORF Transcript_24045/g.68914 Transcript_24045/m.68914 type:complete len:371 (-) Transcript_24045:224-1336(-)